MKYPSKLLGALLFLVVLSGCASITSGKLQPLSVQAKCDNQDVIGAACSLTNSKGQWFVNTPGSVTVHKAYGDLVVDCKKEGLTPAGGTFKSSSNGGVWGNLIAGGVVGYAIDAGNGAGFDYPTQMTVNFTPPCETSPKVGGAAGDVK
jgi:hypothetical protein